MASSTIANADCASGSPRRRRPGRTYPLYAARLFQAGRVDRILVSGGNLPWEAPVKPEAQLVADLLIEFGVRPDAIHQDAESRNTRENAINSAAIMHDQGLRTALLVTSGAHMPRTLAAFRGIGLEMIPAATDIRVVYPLYRSALDFLPDADALALTTDAIKEWIGLAIYRVRGWAQRPRLLRAKRSGRS